MNQARFIREFVHLANRLGWQYNLIEAIDQPWKRDNEGAVGGYWGLFDADRHDKGVLAGPVSNLPHWRAGFAASALLLLVTLALAGRPRSLPAAVALPSLGALAGMSLACWAGQVMTEARYLGEWAWMAGLGVLSLLLLADTAAHLGARAWRMPPHWRSRLALATGFAMAVQTLWMVFDPRYRGFATAGLLVSVLCVLWRPAPLAPPTARLLATVCALGVPLQLLREGWQNPYAWGWLLLTALMAWALARSAQAKHCP